MKTYLMIPATALFLSACVAGGGQPTALRGVPQAEATIYTADTANLATFKQQVAEAKRVSSTFFGRPAANPNYVFCGTVTCDARFGLEVKKAAGARAKTVGDQLIIIGTRGRDQIIINHEQVHADLHSLFSLGDVLRGKLPSWFDEGMAGFVTKDARLLEYPSLKDAKFVMTATTVNQFNVLLSDRSWHRVYGAGTALVADMDRKLGRKGLLNFINRVASGADFNTEMVRVMGPSWPQ